MASSHTVTRLEARSLVLSFSTALPLGNLTRIQGGLRKVGAEESKAAVFRASLSAPTWPAVNGAGGGVGTFAIQLAKLAGAEVTGVDALHKLDVIRSVGADHVIDYTQDDFTKAGERYDLIIDCQNFRSMIDNRRALEPGGTYAMIGGSIARVYQLWFLSLIALLTSEDRELCLVAEGPNKGLADLKELMEVGKLVPVIDSTYRLNEVPEALRYFGAGRHKGKIVIAMENSGVRSASTG